MEKKTILAEINEIEPIISDYNRIKHLFSEDEGEEACAKLNQAIKRIKFLLDSDEVKNVVMGKQPYFQKPLFGGKPGALVKVRPCGEDYEGKTYIGFLIGETATGIGMAIKGDTMTIEFSGGNPCIFIPETGTIVMGYESWWGEIKDENDLRQISNEDIENVWYVKLWKQMAEEKPVPTKQ